MKPHSHRKPASSVRSTLRFSGALLTSLLLIRAAGPAPASDLTLVRNFTGMNGAGPQPTLTLAADGNFYGVTHAGGNGAGTVFKRPAVYGAPQTTLYAFAADGSDGAAPNGVILGQDGALYGTTAFGGAYGNGAVFKLSLSGTLTLLHAFHPVSGTRRTNSDGAHPFAALVQASDGALYGTTEAGGAHGLGVVFRITPGGVFTRLHAFASEEGAFPCAPLLQAGDGDFYGTTRDGGASGAGTLFKMSAAGSVTVLHAFQGGQDGAYPRAGVIQGPDGALYGTTPVGGAANSGTVYRVTLSGTATVLYAFSGGTDGAAPQAGLLLGSDGSFYGTTQRGGYGYGTLFRLTPAGALTSLYTFTPPDTSGASFDGARPSAGLVQTADGFLWGTTPQGGENGTGTFFAIQPTGGLIDIQQTFPPADGANPVGGLIQAGDGNLYGAASFGGANNSGVIFQLTASGAYTEIYSFSELDAEGLNAEGAHPMAALL
ncbi:MAG TPA: choice-of-anchor tandem repeat GloVer-containing protein, partial [Chthonomonadaceae bacterium]|nr:choice-of-anchor tandem repeat GloVer-containing protein [Chthonomonadaceae bacterium]